MLWDWSNARAQDCSRGWSSACVYPGKADNFTVENLSIRKRNFKGLPFLRSRVQLEKTHGWEKYSWTTRDGNFSKRDGLGRDGCATISFSLFSLVHAMRVSSLRHRLRVRGAP